MDNQIGPEVAVKRVIGERDGVLEERRDIVAGDRDEYAPMDELEALASELETAELVELVELVALPGTDHYFMTGLPELGRAAEHFLKRLA